MCDSDSQVFLTRNFWKIERPTSTENETESENSYYPKSETDTVISGTKSEQPVKIIEDLVKNLQSSNNELKNENLKFEYEFEYEKLARLTTEIAAVEDSRFQLGNELLNCKSHNDKLESDNRLLEMQKKKYQTESQEKQAQLEKYENKNNALIKCKVFG